MKIIVVGTGFVGLPHAAVLSEAGHEVYAYDIDPNKIAAYQSGRRRSESNGLSMSQACPPPLPTPLTAICFSPQISAMC